LLAGVINEGREVEVIELVEKVDRARVGRSELELDGRVAAERGGVAKTKECVNLFRDSLDCRLSASTVEGGVVSLLDFCDEMFGEVVC
jgi:hypothetical protein